MVKNEVPESLDDVPVTRGMFKEFRIEVLERFDQVNARIDGHDARFEQIDARFEQIDARFKEVDARFEQIDARFKEVDARFDELRAEMKAGFAELRSDIARIGVVVEEQNARNQVVLEAIRMLLDHDREHSRRLDEHEAALRLLKIT